MAEKLNRIDPSKISSSEDKAQHLRLCLENDMQSGMANGLEKYRLINNPLPEMALDQVDTACRFLGKPMAAPFVISPMTGGSALSETINRNLAAAAQKLGIALTVGSQRLALEHPDLAGSYRIRDVAPDIPVLANIGAVYLNYGFGPSECQAAVDMVGADGLSIYLNPMQKALQGFGQLDFRNLTSKISAVCRGLSVPVLVKEVGFGISPEAARRLADAGVGIIDVAGAGGTSWSKITRHMKKDLWKESAACFDTWGIPTAESLMGVKRAAPHVQIIASGGIRSGIDMAKALALGADYAGMALPLLKPATESAEAVRCRVEALLTELRLAMFCCGARDVGTLRQGDCIAAV